MYLHPLLVRDLAAEQRAEHLRRARRRQRTGGPELRRFAFGSRRERAGPFAVVRPRLGRVL
jgi:hypothetical protein